MRRLTWMVAAAAFSLASCSDGMAPSGGGGGGGGGPAALVIVGNNFFRSTHNGSQNDAVDTIAAGTSVKWAWNAAGSHSIQSTGTPGIFRNSVIMSGANDSYTVTFKNPGTYTYDCAVHGSAMTGRIVVQ